MILQALYAYYNRKVERNEIAPEGFIEKEIDLLIVLDEDGRYVDIENIQTANGKRLRGRKYYAPAIGKQAQKHTMAGDDANLLWDKSEFVLGVGTNGKKKLNSFIDTIHAYYPDPPKDVKAVLNFYSNETKKDKPFQKILTHKEFGEMLRSGASLISFRIESYTAPIICQPHITAALNKRVNPDEVLGVCLLTGDTNVPIERYHNVIKRIRGSQPAGANLVSFDDPAFTSFGKERGMNAPVSKRAAAGYTKALQSLVDSDTNRVRISDSTMVFWAERKERSAQSYDMETEFPWFINESPKDDPDRNVRAVKSLYESYKSGRLAASNDRFYVLGLATPSKSRITLRLFRQGTIRDFGEKIKMHFDDLEIVRSPFDQEFLSLDRILASVSSETKDRKKPNVLYFKGKYYEVIPNLAEAVIESYLDGTAYPMTLLHQCMRRIRAEVSKKDQNGKPVPNVTRARAAILKATINRFNRIHKPQEKEITMALDPTNKNPGYRLGRLFATLEKIQEEANPGINTTIRDRFYSSASTSPVAVFSQLLRLKNHHIPKLETGRKIYFEKLIGEIKSELSEYPAHLTLNDQAYFSLGYYHQRQDFFTSKKTEENSQS